MIRNQIKHLLFNRRNRDTLHRGIDCKINPDSQFRTNTFVGDGTSINGPMLVKGCESVYFGKYCACGRNIIINTHNHGITHANINERLQRNIGCKRVPLDCRGPVLIRNGVWIGDNVIILTGVEIGDGAVIGAGSVVTRSIPPYAVAVGSPAKVIRLRFSDDKIAYLNGLQWWDWTLDEMRKHKHFFEEYLA